MDDGRIDTAEAAQALYGGRGLDDYGNTPPESNSNPSPFGKGTDNDLGRTPQKAEQGGQQPHGKENPFEAGQKTPEFDYGQLEANGAPKEQVESFREATRGLKAEQVGQLTELHRKVSEDYWGKQESEGFATLEEEYGGDLDRVATEVNGVLRQFDPDNELATMLKTYRMQANPAVFRFLHRVAGHISRGGDSHGR